MLLAHICILTIYLYLKILKVVKKETPTENKSLFLLKVDFFIKHKPANKQRKELKAKNKTQ